MELSIFAITCNSYIGKNHITIGANYEFGFDHRPIIIKPHHFWNEIKECLFNNHSITATIKHNTVYTIQKVCSIIRM